MSQAVDREGTFRGLITEYGLKEFDSGAVAVAIKARLDQIWTGDEWQDWSEYGMEAEGNIWIVGKEGKPNDRGVESLIKYAGWDGNILAVSGETWKPIPSQFVIKAEVYQGRTFNKIAFVNDHDRTPGGTLSNMSEDKVKSLATRFGSQFKAIAGNAKKSMPTTPGAIPARPPKNGHGNGSKPPPPRAESTPEDDIPF